MKQAQTVGATYRQRVNHKTLSPLTKDTLKANGLYLCSLTRGYIALGPYTTDVPGREEREITAEQGEELGKKQGDSLLAPPPLTPKRKGTAALALEIPPAQISMFPLYKLASESSRKGEC